MLLHLLLGCPPAVIVTTTDSSTTDSTTDSSPPDSSGDAAYDASILHTVEIEIDAAEWAAIRQEQRDLLNFLAGDECMAAPLESPYTWVPATVTLDGQALEAPIEVRKKGLLGSVTSDRPSLKLRLDSVDDDQRFDGLTDLTFNNGRQDVSRIKTCLGYEILAEMGQETSRCSLAHVTVNGEDLGVYANVEPIKAPMLERSFGDSGGELYEGTLSDFAPGWDVTFQNKNDSGNDAPITAITAVLQDDPDDLLGALDQVLDVEQFVRFWALEGLIGHWDGYAGNTNNFWVYADPSDGRARFLFWGIDAVLTGGSPFGAGHPTSVVTRGALSRAIYEDPDGKRMYWDQMQQLVDAWDSDHWAQRVDEMEALIEDAVWPGQTLGDFRNEVGNVRSFVSSRPNTVQSEIDSPPRTPDGQRAWPCLGEVGTLDVTWDTTWGSYGTQPTWSTGSGTMAYTIRGESYPVTFLSAVTGEYQPGGSVLLVAGTLENGANIAFYAVGPTGYFTEPGTVAADWSQLTTYLLYDSDGDLTGWNTAAYLGWQVHMDTASATPQSQHTGHASMSVLGGG